MPLPLPQLKLKLPKGKIAKAVAGKVKDTRTKLEKEAEKLGAKVGKAIKKAAIKKGKELVDAGLAKIGIKTPSQKRKEAKLAKEARRFEGGGDVRSAAAQMGHAGKGSPHNITPADRERRRRQMRSAQKLRWKGWKRKTRK